jgi:hypothetical protein
MDKKQFNNSTRMLINERKKLIAKIKDLFHRCEKGSPIYFKVGNLYRNALKTLREMEASLG